MGDPQHPIRKHPVAASTPVKVTPPMANLLSAPVLFSRNRRMATAAKVNANAYEYPSQYF
jgi:hypothetical protein